MKVYNLLHFHKKGLNMYLSIQLEHADLHIVESLPPAPSIHVPMSGRRTPFNYNYITHIIQSYSPQYFLCKKVSMVHATPANMTRLHFAGAASFLRPRA